MLTKIYVVTCSFLKRREESKCICSTQGDLTLGPIWLWWRAIEKRIWTILSKQTLSICDMDIAVHMERSYICRLEVVKTGSATDWEKETYRRIEALSRSAVGHRDLSIQTRTVI